MSKYYVVEISTGDAKIAGKSIYEYNSYNEAVGSFHSKLGTAMKSDLYATELVMVVYAYGNVAKSEYYAKPENVTE